MILFLPILARLLPVIAEGVIARGGIGAILGRGGAAAAAGGAEGAGAAGVAESLATKEAARNYGPSAASQYFEAAKTVASTSKQTSRKGFASPSQAGTNVFQPANAQPASSPAAAGKMPLSMGDLKKVGEGLFGLGKKVLAFELGLYTVIKGLQMFGESIAESRRELGAWNYRIANAFVNLDIGRMQRNIELGGATAASTEGVVDALDVLEQELMPIRVATTNLMNRVAEIGLRAAAIGAAIAKHLPYLGTLIDIMAWLESSEDKADDNKALRDAFKDLKRLDRMMPVAPTPLPPPKGPVVPIPPVIPGRRP